VEGTPRYLRQLRTWLEPLVLRLTGKEASQLEGVWNDLFKQLQTLPPSLFQSAGAILWGATTGLVNFLLLLDNKT
jgi:predicted PurR-regulated permease PerM